MSNLTTMMPHLHGNMTTMAPHHTAMMHNTTMGGHHHMTTTGHMGHMGSTAMPGHGTHGMAGGEGGHMMMMQMYFVAGNQVTLLFKGWKTTTDAEMLGSCIALLIIAFLYEGLKVGRELLKVRQRINFVLSASDNNKNFTGRMFSGMHFLQTFLHMLQVFIGYLLMLAFMTYNAWVCLAVILGAGLGYFAFGWKVNTITSEGDHCN